MKVILLQDVAKIGRRHAVVEVPDGYARNKLIPMRAALPATKEVIARYAAIQAQAVAGKEASSQAISQSLATLATLPVVVFATANEQGHLFKAITKEDVAAATTAAGAPLPASALVIQTPIKAVGTHQVVVRQGESEGVFTVVVEAKKK